MIEFLDFLPYGLAAVAPLTIYVAISKYFARRQRTRFLGNLPQHKQVPSDDVIYRHDETNQGNYVIYRYDNDDRMNSRWVYADEIIAQSRVRTEKNRGLSGRLFKNGVMLREW